jgi:hypothetical protein
VANPLKHLLQYDSDEGGSSEPHEYPGGEAGGHDPWYGQPTVGPQDHGPVSPSHGAAGGHSIEFPYRGNPGPSQITTGMTNSHPEMGAHSPPASTVKIAQK